MRTTLKFTLYTVLLIVLLSLWAFYLTLRPIRFTSTMTPADRGITYENVTFKTSDDVTIKGWFIPSKRTHAKTILLLHGYPADKGNILPTRLFLHKDYHLLFIDFRHLGESGGNYSTVGVDEVRDVRAAIDYLKTRGIHEIGIWGLSMGGAAALMSLKDAPEVKAVIAEAPYARLGWVANQRYPIPGLGYLMGSLFRLWGVVFLQTDINKINPVANAKTATIPVLLIYSRNDKVIPIQHAALMRRETAGNKYVEMIIVEDKPHNEVLHNYQEVVSEFFKKHLNARYAQ